MGVRWSPTMLKKILIGLAAVLVLLLILIAMQPSYYHVRRTAAIAAPPSTVFPLINDFHRWNDWSPWSKMDPAMKVTYGGAPAGKGATYHWAGNSDVGEGTMEIAESQPDSKIGINLDFIKPFAGHSLTVFNVTPTATGSAVEWDMGMENNYMGKAMGLFMNMDKMIGTQFEQGLAQMKTIAESAAHK